MRIKCLTLFRDGTREFQKDDVVSVEAKDGIRFTAHGWAVEVGATPPAAGAANVTADLNIQSSKMGTTSTL